MVNYGERAGEILSRIRASKPVVHSITNYVVMNSTANVLLAMGASPIMAHATEEMEDISAISNSLVINIGTLSHTWIEAMQLACHIAVSKGKPIVLDPVGAGATKLRTETALRIIGSTPPTVIRCNASEVLSLSGREGSTRGVDSVHNVPDAVETACSIALSLGTVIAVTGERDLVTDGSRSLIVAGGDPMMGYVTGTGCAASVIVGAFLAEEKDAVIAAAAALAFFGLAGQNAAAEAKAPGSFWVKTVDALYSITPEDLAESTRITEA
ncbi:MAG: hydroxyethylthiazole kinase [Deltaproteobacteria bacterium]|nr:hydroxyethylthiazole kinase [Deltaproteobacteria bacterium]